RFKGPGRRSKMLVSLLQPAGASKRLQHELMRLTVKGSKLDPDVQAGEKLVGAGRYSSDELLQYSSMVCAQPLPLRYQPIAELGATLNVQPRQEVAGKAGEHAAQPFSVERLDALAHCVANI